MADSATVREWAKNQDPPLVKGEGRGRFSKQLIESFNAAHPDDAYEPSAKPRKKAKVEETPAPTAETTAAALRPEHYEHAPADSSRVAHVLPVNPPADATYADGAEYETERYTEAP